MNTSANILDSVDKAVDEIIELTDGDIVIAMPLGLGKPNRLINALYQRACDDADISLSILTALSITRPHASSELEERFLKPFIARVYGDYEELSYLRDRRKNKLPKNVQVNEFFVQPASELNNAYAQQHYLNSNYTHAARDINKRKANVFAQMVASNKDGALSYSCNPEVSLDLAPLIKQRLDAGEKIVRVGQVHHQLPFMGNSAELSADDLDIIIDDEEAQQTLISTPNTPVSVAEHFIGLHASALVKDGGTLQIGIGALGDALAGALLLRQKNNAQYQSLLSESGISQQYSELIAEEGGQESFVKGLYGCSEMFTYGLFRLFQAGIVKRNVKDKAGRDICMHGGFFLGPNAFYEGLNNLSEQDKNKIDLTNISFVNHLYGDEALKRSQRVDGRFINTAFIFTLMGAAVADQLEDGRVLSGVGGQYNFVAQAHELEGARSVMLVRASKEKNGQLNSNLVWNYGHVTVPRHLRDIVITEYGIADLRSKNDAECIAAMLNIADSRFQAELLAEAKQRGKIAEDYSIPEPFTNNTPARLETVYQKYSKQGAFPEYPLGCDFDSVEQDLLRALKWAKKHSKATDLAKVLLHMRKPSKEIRDRFSAHLKRMGLSRTIGFKEKLYYKLVLAGLLATKG